MTNTDYLTAEARARVEIDRQLAECGWLVQDRTAMNLSAGQGVAVREFIMAPGHGRADYLLFVDGTAVGAVEAKPAGTALAGVEPQSAKYAAGLPANLPRVADRLPFLYEATGAETMFTVPSIGCRMPESAAEVSARVFISATSPAYSMMMPVTASSVSWPAKEPSFSATAMKGLSRGASSAEMEGMLRALETAPEIR